MPVPTVLRLVDWVSWVHAPKCTHPSYGNLYVMYGMKYDGPAMICVSRTGLPLADSWRDTSYEACEDFDCDYAYVQYQHEH